MSSYNTLGKAFCDQLAILIDTIPAETSCPMCEGALTECYHRHVVETGCKHAFHYTCLRLWLSSGENSCPTCGLVFYYPNAAEVPGMNSQGSADFSFGLESIPTPYGIVDQDHQFPITTQNYVSTDSGERNFHLIEQYSRAQHRRAELLQDLSALVLEDEQLTHAELQSFESSSSGEFRERNGSRMERLGLLSMQQRQVLPEIWVLNAKIDEVLSEEAGWRYSIDFDDWVAAAA